MKAALLFLLINIFLLWATQAHAQVYKVGNCFAAPVMRMVIEEKIDSRHYLVNQHMGSTKIGVIEVFKGMGFTKKGFITHLNISYVETKKIKGNDGFEYDVDFWKQCEYNSDILGRAGR